jgi:precorrin-4 methylase
MLGCIAQSISFTGIAGCILSIFCTAATIDVSYSFHSASDSVVLTSNDLRMENPDKAAFRSFIEATIRRYFNVSSKYKITPQVLSRKRRIDHARDSELQERLCMRWGIVVLTG